MTGEEPNVTAARATTDWRARLLGAVFDVLLVVALVWWAVSALSDNNAADGGADPSPDPPVREPRAGEALVVSFLDVGQGDATLLQAPDATVLIDAGRHDRADVVAHLEDLGVADLDVVVVTHPHADHLGQFDDVLERFDVAEVWWSGAVHDTQTFVRALAALDASQATYEEPRAGDTTTVGSLRVDVVNPPTSADFEDLHDSSLALRISYDGVALLFTGDAETATEQRMLAEESTLAADIHQLGHHGSATSTSQALLEAVDPAAGVYSAGADNQYGHPHEEVVARLSDAGVGLYGTAGHGTVTVTVRDGGWEVTTERGG